MTLPTPYDGSSPLFRIGTKPLDPADWLGPDAAMASQLGEKARLLAERPGEVFAELPESRPAQAELLALLVDHLPRHFPALWRHSNQHIEVLPTAQAIPLDGEESPLLTAAKLVQDDLLLLQRGDAGWRLTAGSLCFPSSWVLSEKMGKVLADIHAPVPGFGPGTRQAEVMARMFDAMRPETLLIRWNFSLYGDDRLFHPDVSGPEERRFGTGQRADPVFLRVERQTLRKLSETGAIAFTIRISVDPLERLEAHADGAKIAASLIDQIEALTPEQLAYKGLTREKDRVVKRLVDFASAQGANRSGGAI
jgi:dimethylamine monooxygenase subunit A